MSSADFSHPFEGEISRGKIMLFHQVLPDLPISPPNDCRASRSIARLPGETGLLSGFCSSEPDFASSFLQISPRSEHPCFQLRFPSLRLFRDFHPLEDDHARHTIVSALQTPTSVLGLTLFLNNHTWFLSR